MEKEIVERFLGKFVKLEKKTFDPNNPDRTTFKLYGRIESVTDITVLIYTNRGMGAILLDEIVGISEAPNKKGGQHE